MDIPELSAVMSQSNVQQLAGIALTKMAMNTCEQNAANITEMMSNVSVDPNLGNNLDVMA